MVRAPVCGTGGHQFESDIPPHFLFWGVAKRYLPSHFFGGKGMRNETPISQSEARSSSGQTVRRTVWLLRRESRLPSHYRFRGVSKNCRRDGIGRRAGLKIRSWRQGAGSTPAAGTIKTVSFLLTVFI